MIFAWPLTLKNPCTNMDPNLFFQNCKQQYWDKLNEVKTPWVLIGAASSKHIKSAYLTAWTFIWPLIYCALALRKCLENFKKILNQQDPKFFLFFSLELWFVTTYHVFCSFSTLVHKVNEAWKWHKIKNLDLWPQFTSCVNEWPIKFSFAFAS